MDLATANGLPRAAVNPPEPFPISTVTLSLMLFATARSGIPSRLKSPTATEEGPVPAGNGLPTAAVNEPETFALVTVKLRVTEVAAP